MIEEIKYMQSWIWNPLMYSQPTFTLHCLIGKINISSSIHAWPKYSNAVGKTISYKQWVQMFSEAVFIEGE